MKTELVDVVGNHLLVREYTNADMAPRLHLMAIEGPLTFSMAFSPEEAGTLADFLAAWLQDVEQRLDASLPQAEPSC